MHKLTAQDVDFLGRTFDREPPTRITLGNVQHCISRCLCSDVANDQIWAHRLAQHAQQQHVELSVGQAFILAVLLVQTLDDTLCLGYWVLLEECFQILVSFNTRLAQRTKCTAHWLGRSSFIHHIKLVTLIKRCFFCRGLFRYSQRLTVRHFPCLRQLVQCLQGHLILGRKLRRLLCQAFCNHGFVFCRNLVVATFKGVLVHILHFREHIELHGVGVVSRLLGIAQQVLQGIPLGRFHVLGNLVQNLLQVVQSFLWQGIALCQVRDTSNHVRQRLVCLFCRGILHQTFKGFLVQKCSSLIQAKHTSSQSIMDVQNIHHRLYRVRDPAVKRVGSC